MDWLKRYQEAVKKALEDRNLPVEVREILERLVIEENRSQKNGSN